MLVYRKPADKQKLLCNGKERKNAAETLTAAGVKGNAKLMLMLAPGFKMPEAPASANSTSDAAGEAAADGDVEMEGAALNIDGELPLPEGFAASADTVAGSIHVRQGRHRYHIKVPQGLTTATFGELADYLVSSLLFPPGVPANELRFICKGKTAERSQPLAAVASKEASVLLMFREGFHLAEEGATWLKERSSELEQAEVEIEKLRKRIEANFSEGAETSVRLAKVCDLIGTLKQSVEIVRVREDALPEMVKFRDRVLAADTRLEEIRKGNRL